MKFYCVLLCLLMFACVPKSNTGDSTKSPEEVETTTTTTGDEANEVIETNTPTGAFPHHFICYKGDGGSKLEISIAFDEKYRAHLVQYKGQQGMMSLRFEKEDVNTDAATPNVRTIYSELVDDKVNGTYLLTHAGNMDYATYTRGRDGKVFKFTIDHDKLGEDGNYRTTSCFVNPEAAAVDAENNVTDYFICYEGDNESGLAVSINFNEVGRALGVMYRGQTDHMKLAFVKESMETNGAYPTTTTTYNEMYDGKINGAYLLTHSGNWDYAQYTRGRDGKVFTFTIDHELSISGDGYRLAPCYYVEPGHD